MFWRPVGISRGLTNSPLDCWLHAAARRPVPGRGTRIWLRPLGGACPLRPLALLRLPVSAAGGGRLRSNSSYGSKKTVPSLSEVTPKS